MAYVLVVDDDDDIRRALREVLADEGYAVETAEHGRQALDVLEHIGNPCLMLLDMMMPVMDGLELLGRLRADANLAKIPVVVVTAAAPRELNVETKVLTKPVRLDVLLSEVERFCVPVQAS